MPCGAEERTRVPRKAGELARASRRMRSREKKVITISQTKAAFAA
jgi:hypothetical protein